MRAGGPALNHPGFANCAYNLGHRQHPRFIMRIFPALLLLGSVSFSPLAHADGVADLKSALTRLQGSTPLKAQIDVVSLAKFGEGKEQEETPGRASLSVEDGQRGLQVLYSKELLARLDSEQTAKQKDSKSKTPTVAALREVSSTELHPMLSAANSLNRLLEKSVFKHEKETSYNGKPARLLNFEMPIDKLSEKDRKYIKKFDATLEIWIAQDGTPLASHLQQNISGRALVVISFESKSDEATVYGVAGDRLIMLRKESKNSSSGAGERGDTHVTKSLQLQS
jgi:hypothetical protein